MSTPGAKTLDCPILNHDYRALNNFRWSEQPGGGDASLHREFVIVKNRAELDSGLYSPAPRRFRTLSAAVYGIDANLIDVEVDVGEHRSE